MNIKTPVYVINEERFIYKIESIEELSSKTLGFCVNLELVAGYDYINPDENDIQGFVQAEIFTDDVQGDIFTIYPLHESLSDRLEEEDYKVIDINNYKIHTVITE